MGPHLGICVAVNPCYGTNAFLGLKGLQSFHTWYVNCGHGDVSLQVKPRGMFYSAAMGLDPPDWRTGLPPAWGVDPAAWLPQTSIGGWVRGWVAARGVHGGIRGSR